MEAYGGLIKLLIAQHQDYPSELLSYIVQIIYIELTREGVKNTATVYGVIQYSCTLFSRGIRGVNILIPLYLLHIGRLVNN